MLHALDPDRNGEVIWETRVGRIIHIRGPSFGGVEHGIAADRERAYVPIADIDVMENTAFGALVAVNLDTGSIAWRAEATEDWCNGKPDRCYTAMTSPPTISGDVVFAGANDGVLRAYDRKTGEIAWEFDTAIPVAGRQRPLRQGRLDFAGRHSPGRRHVLPVLRIRPGPGHARQRRLRLRVSARLTRP